MAQAYMPPKFRADAFNCPHCGAYAYQLWGVWQNYDFINVEDKKNPVFALSGARCACCGKYSYWYSGEIIYPAVCTAPMPNEDMPEECKKLYNEARGIADKSPRAAGALLRLCVEKLLPHLGGNKPKLADNIQALVDAGKITAEERQYLDICRLIGNDAVHPREIALSDNREMVFPLFDFINILIQRTLTADKQRQSFIDKLPKNIQDKVKRED